MTGPGPAGEPPGERLRVALLTREYPPEVYGGAGVHVEYLARELSKLVDLAVHCQGKDRPDAVAHRPWGLLAGTNQALQTISTDLSMTAGVAGSDLVHSHTWYANLGGHLASLLYGIPHVVTMHSLEPLRPWKAEQLGGGYALSSWCERVAATAAAAIIAVSAVNRLGVRTGVRAQNALVVTRLAGLATDGLELLDRVNRSGVGRALPAITALVDNGDLDRIVALARVVGSAQDALSDDMVTRLAGLATDAMAILDRVTRNGFVDRWLTLADRVERSGLLSDLIGAIDQAGKEVTTAPRPQGGFAGLWTLMKQQQTQEAAQFVNAIIRALRAARVKSG